MNSRKLSFKDQLTAAASAHIHGGIDHYDNAASFIDGAEWALAQQAHPDSETFDMIYDSALELAAKAAQQALPLTDEMVEAAFVTRWEHLNGGASHREKHRERAWFKDGFLTRDRMAQQAQPEPLTAEMIEAEVSKRLRSTPEFEHDRALFRNGMVAARDHYER